MSTEHNPFETPKTIEPEGRAKEERNPYWGRTTLLDWYQCSGIRARLRWLAGIFLAANGVSYFFGFIWPKLLICGIAALVISFLLPRSLDE